MDDGGGIARPLKTIGLAALLFAAACGRTDGEGAPATVSLSHPALSGPGGLSIADVAEGAVPSVVNISSERRVQVCVPQPGTPEWYRHFFGTPKVPRTRLEQSLGSGVIVSTSGIILTNHHVVEDAEAIVVTLSNGRDVPAKLAGADPRHDLAVLRLTERVEGLVPLPFGDSDRLRLGEIVLAIGNPFGVGQTLTMGIVSATGRSHEGIIDDEALIQTDAAINPGNSGGALVDLRGRLVGINTAILSRSGGHEGVGFAIPTNLAKPILERLVERGAQASDEPGWIGAIFLDPAPGRSRVEAPYVSDLIPGGPAEWAGLRRGDAVVAVDGTSVRSADALRDTVAARGAGAWIFLDVLREGEAREIPVPVEAPPPFESKRFALGPREGPLGGLVVGELDAAGRARYGIPDRVPAGAVVVGVAPDGLVARSGLREGDAILEVNGEPVTSVKRFVVLYRTLVRDRLELEYYREGTTMILTSRRG